MDALIISDIHLGLTNINIEEHIQEVVSFITESVKANKTDTLIISGDLFEQQLYLNATSVEVSKFAIWLDNFCYKNGIILLLLRGTISHDYRQMEFISTLMVKCTYFYQDTLSIVKVRDEDVLFVPDSLGLSEEELTDATKELLEKYNITKVDVSIMHGMFKHHIDMPDVPVMDQVFFSLITKHYVIVGHNHAYTKWHNIYTPGSLTRWTHGQEIDKGGLYMSTGDIPFIKRLINNKAVIYKTLTIDDIKELNNAIEDIHVTCKHGSHIRLIIGEVSSELKHEIKRRLSPYVVKIESGKVEKEAVVFRKTEAFSITKENIVGLISDRCELSTMALEELEACL